MNKYDLKSIRKKERIGHVSTVIGMALWLCVFIIGGHSCSAKADIYIKIGTGYKLIETEYLVLDDGSRIGIETGGKISARIEIGKESGNWSYGLAHQSQWFAGFPFDKDEETEKTEIFIDYKWTL